MMEGFTPKRADGGYCPMNTSLTYRAPTTGSAALYGIRRRDGTGSVHPSHVEPHTFTLAFWTTILPIVAVTHLPTSSNEGKDSPRIAIKAKSAAP
ncbi:hypothetical protein PMIN01_00941 [Paraphaeosphaeria minitans]|uniref:Uncharacterized protein n=1 Tax=Paraphaeosphaeria minitans TaxID=565426 RepID=A0A9P6GT69_9PLEO|nr:hypothetical protein PMIN01_00941 [Paraphaeosphaeria minitans]